MPDIRLYLGDDLYFRWKKIPTGLRSKIMQELLEEYFKGDGKKYLKPKGLVKKIKYKLLGERNK